MQEYRNIADKNIQKKKMLDPVKGYLEVTIHNMTPVRNK